MATQPPSGLPEIHAYVTTHDEKTGKSFYRSSDPVEWKFWNPNGNDIIYATPYSTSQWPIVMTGEADIKAHEQYMTTKSTSVGLANGSNMRILDLPPGYKGVIHRTVSLDYGIVIEGEVNMVLDTEGEARIMKRGDIIIQRGTMHGVCNASPTEWARIAFVVVDVEKVKVGGKELDEKWTS